MPRLISLLAACSLVAHAVPAQGPARAGMTNSYADRAHYPAALAAPASGRHVLPDSLHHGHAGTGFAVGAVLGIGLGVAMGAAVHSDAMYSSSSIVPVLGALTGLTFGLIGALIGSVVH